jgi:hypothetical protein
MALGHAAVHQDIDAAAAGVRLKPDQVAGAGDAGLGAEMGDGDGVHFFRLVKSEKRYRWKILPLP